MAVFNFNKLSENNEQLAWFIFDIVMVSLALVNINLIIFDFTFSYSFAQQMYAWAFPKLTAWYDINIHQNFVLIDMAFVAFFLLEFGIRWIVAAVKKEYQKWWFFPFARWYDLLGLIPIGSFRFLRVLRLVSIVFRLQNMGVLRLQESSFYPFINKYYSIFVEEISDRVVINVLDGVKDEMSSGDDVAKQIIDRVIKPNNERMVQFTMLKVQEATQQIIEHNLPEIKKYLFDKVQAAVNDNSEMKLIKSVPGIGGVIRKQLDHAISDITYKVIVGIIEDVAKGEDVFTKDAHLITLKVIESIENDDELEDFVEDITNETIEILKIQVAQKKWQQEK